MGVGDAAANSEAGQHRRRAQRLRMVGGARAGDTPSTIPYYIYKLQLLARSDDESIKSWDDLRAKPGERRKRVGVLQGSRRRRYIEKEFGDSVELMKYPEVTMVMGLSSREARCHGPGRADRHVLRPRISRVCTPSASRSNRATTSATCGTAMTSVARAAQRGDPQSDCTMALCAASTKSTACGTTTSCGWRKSPKTGRQRWAASRRAGPTCRTTSTSCCGPR